MLLLSALEIVLQNGCSADRCCVRTVKKICRREGAECALYALYCSYANELIINRYTVHKFKDAACRHGTQSFLYDIIVWFCQKARL